MSYTSDPTKGIISTLNSSTNNVGGTNALAADATIGSTTISLLDSSMFPSSGTIKIDAEYITYTRNSNNVLSGAIRGSFNTTDVTHAAGAVVIGVYIGTSVYSAHPDVMTSLKSDRAGTEYFDFSNDNVNWDTYPTAGFAVTANVHEFHVAVKGVRYFRVRFETSEATATTSFRITTYLGTYRQGNLPLNQAINDDADSLVVRSIQVGANPTGNYTNVKSSGYIFQTSTPLDPSGSITTGILEVDGFTQIQTELFSNVSGVLTGTWYSDLAGTKLIRTFTRPYLDSDTGNYVYFSSPLFAKFLKYTYVNNGTIQTAFHLAVKLTVQPISGQILGLNDYIPQNIVANMGRNVIAGQNSSGNFVNVPVTSTGHLEVALHEPVLPFGSVHAENITPIFQHDSVYGINPSEINSTIGHLAGGVSSGVVSGANNLFSCSTGTTAYSFSTIQSRERLRYRPGQGVISRFTALFSTPSANSILVAGVGTGESGFFFGYHNNLFGILHSTQGIREIRILTINTASTSANNYNVQLNGVTFNITATNNGSTIATAYQISIGSYTGWSAEARGNTVVFLADSVGARSGAYSLTQTGAGTPAAGTYSTTLSGANTVDTWYYQTEWNVDKMDGNGNSGVILNPQFGNVYQIDIQYLGFGAITFKIETAPDGNNAVFNVVHIINIPNRFTTVNVSQPSFPFTMAAYSAGSTTDVSVKVGSFAGFIEGIKVLSGPRYTYQRETNNFVGSTASTYYPLFTIRNSYCHAHSITQRPNQSVVNIISMSCSHDDTTPVGFFLIKNAILAGTPNFLKFSTSSCTYWDQASTTCTISDNDSLVSSLQTGQATGETITFADPILLQPGETITLAARAVSGTATYVSGSLNSREDQ